MDLINDPTPEDVQRSALEEKIKTERQGLRELMEQRFSIGALQQLISYRLQLNPEAIEGPKANIQELVHSLISHTQRQGRLVDLLIAIRLEQPDHPAVVAYCNHVGLPDDWVDFSQATMQIPPQSEQPDGGGVTVSNSGGEIGTQISAGSIEGDVAGENIIGRDQLTAGGDIDNSQINTIVNIGQVIIGQPAGPATEEMPIDWDGEPPYLGLRSFGVGDTDRYFGRDKLITTLINRIRDEKLKFLMVVGASGSGKSSLVQAGIVATLKRGRAQQVHTELPAGAERWPVHIIRPTSDPIKQLANSLTRDAERMTAATNLMDDLKEDARSLDLYIGRMLDGQEKDMRLLLVVDQFEELFTACEDEAARQAFVDNLMHAIDPKTDCPILLICTLRADFYHCCLDYNSLSAALEHRQANVLPMSPQELRLAIEEPAEAGAGGSLRG